MIHGELTGKNIHVPYSFEYTDLIQRESSTGFLQRDVGKFCRQLDDNTIWILTSTNPVQWSGIASGVSTGTIAAAGSGIAFPVTPIAFELFYRTDLNGVYIWNNVIWEEISTQQYAHKSVFAYDERPSGAYPSILRKDKWNVRTTTRISDPHGLIGLVSDDFTLQAGLYSIRGNVVGSGKLRLFNETTGIAEVVGTLGEREMHIMGNFAVTDSSYLFEIQHYCTDDEEEEPLDNGSNEIYLAVEIQRIGDI